MRFHCVILAPCLLEEKMTTCLSSWSSNRTAAEKLTAAKEQKGSRGAVVLRASQSQPLSGFQAAFRRGMAGSGGPAEHQKFCRVSQKHPACCSRCTAVTKVAPQWLVMNPTCSSKGVLRLLLCV